MKGNSQNVSAFVKYTASKVEINSQNMEFHWHSDGLFSLTIIISLQNTKYQDNSTFIFEL